MAEDATRRSASLGRLRTVVSGVFDDEDQLPAHGFPEGVIQWRMQTGEPVLAHLKAADGSVRWYQVVEKDGYWTPGREVQRRSVAQRVKSNLG